MYLIIGKVDYRAIIKIFDKNFKVAVKMEKNDGDLLKITDSLLKKLRKNTKDISGVAVINDSGSFSGVRSATTVANILSFALKIPATSISINDIDDTIKIKKVFKNLHGRKIILPEYSRPPNITISKK